MNGDKSSKSGLQGDYGYSKRNILILCAASIVINLAFGLAASALGLPVYLDSIGTVFAAALGGYMPGIAVGFLTNVIKGALDHESIYYGIFNIFIAICVAFFSDRGYFKKPLKAFIIVPVLAAATGVMDTVLAWFLGGGAMETAAGSLATYLAENTGLSVFMSCLVQDLLTELCDKAITIAVSVAVIMAIPKTMRDSFRAEGLWQAPMSAEMKQELKKSKCRSASFRTKIILILVVASVLTAGSSAVISYQLFKNSVISEHIKLANGVSELVADSIDAEMTDEYIEKGEAAEGYKETEQRLYKLRESSPDIEYIYVYKITEEGCRVVFDLDTGGMEGSEPGELIEFDEAFASYLPALMAGEEIEPVISNDTYGYLLTAYKPVYDETGTCRCYAAADISMSLLSSYGYGFMARLVSIMLGFFLMILAIGTWIVKHSLILPVNTMAYCAGEFAYNSDKAREDSVQRLKGLNIHTGDEIENLYNAFVKTTEESMRYVTDIQHKTEMISKMQNGLIMVLADMVESRDKCTGDHVRKTAAYAKLIMKEMKRRGMYKSQLTDQFIEDVTNAAPLHDVGKIYISDTILNKPGKLTDEEFEIMKQHTTLGSQIIDRAIEMVPESGYLEEAKNLSEYHHEKWNGKGYPHGLSGEDIPLSARIMAVADVFDALVSRRSYKTPFSFEKAMSIIREDAGTHFDPVVAEAFLDAEDEVRKIAEDFAREDENGDMPE